MVIFSGMSVAGANEAKQGRGPKINPEKAFPPFARAAAARALRLFKRGFVRQHTPQTPRRTRARAF
jgi:hypothetical protein